GGSVAEIAGDGAAVLDLDGADLASSGLQGRESGRQAGAGDVGPGGGAADAPMIRFAGDAAKAGDGGDVEDALGLGPVDKSRVEVGTAGHDHQGAFLAKE